MKKIFTLCFLIIALSNSFAQQIAFQKTYGVPSYAIGYSVQQTADGGYIIACAAIFPFGAGSVDAYLIKTNANGDTLWTKTFGGTGIDEGWSVQQTTDGGYIIAGRVSGLGLSTTKVCLIKTDANGDTLWTKAYFTGYGEGYFVRQTIDGGFIIAGRTTSGPGGNSDIFLLKTDVNGNTIWSKTFGGASHEWGYSVQQTLDGGYITIGRTENFGAGNWDFYLVKTDSIGNYMWSKTFGGFDDEWGYSVQQTTDGGYIFTGITNSFGAGNSDIYVIKTDSIGNLLWSKTFGGANDDWSNSVIHTTDGGYLIVGNANGFNANLYLIKVDSNGDSLWTKFFGGSIYGQSYCVQQTTDAGFIICGAKGVTNGVFLIKTDSLGNSGCNHVNSAIIVTTPATQVTNPSTIITNPFTSVDTLSPTINSGGTVTTLCFSTGFPSATPNLQSAITISPNPTSNKFTITFPNIINKGAIEIYNVLGEKMMEENIFNTTQKEIHLENISAGIYFVKVRGEEKEYAEKFVVK